MKLEEKETGSASDLARRLLELRERRAKAVAQMEELKRQVEGLDQQLDGILKTVVACV